MAKKYPGKLITLEGSEGAGKSTCIDNLSKYLTTQGKEVVVTREPGGTVVGEQLREILLHQGSGTLSPETELLMMFAARAEHFVSVIEPALNKGQWVLSDRFVDASYAYQGGGRGIPAEKIRVLEQWLLEGFQADLVLVLDLPVEEGLKRVNKRGVKDRFEQEEMAFFRRVREVYLARARQNPTRIRVVDAAMTQEKVAAALIQELRRLG